MITTPTKQSWCINAVSLSLIVGPDSYHATHLRVESVKEMLYLLTTEWKIVYTVAPGTGLHERIGDAIHEWYSTWGEEEGAPYPEGWRWLGISAVPMNKDPQMSWGLHLTDRTVFNLQLDAGAINAEAAEACREIHRIAGRIIGERSGYL